MANHILVVDDNDMNLMLVSKILELEGYEVAVACDGTEALESVIANKPDLALLDVMMPDMDGYELCKKLRQPPINADMPIIMLTAMNSDMEKGLAIEAGANDIWSKPFDMDTFRRRVAELVTTS
jgi:two-component system, sensor histidine kinase and response regulator